LALDIRKLKDRAAEQMAKRRFDKAAESYAKLCEADPADLTLRQRLGDAQRQGGKVHDAVITYQMVADRFAREGLLLKAIAVNKVILELDPTHTATQATLATLYAQRQTKAVPVVRVPAPQAASPEGPEAIELPEEEVELELDRPSAAASTAKGKAKAAVIPDFQGGAATPIDDLAAAAEAAAAQIDDGDEGLELELEPAALELEEDEGIELNLAPPAPAPVAAAPPAAAPPAVVPPAVVPPVRAPADPLSAFARGSSDAPAPELSLDLDAEMDQEIAKAPAAPPPAAAAAPPAPPTRFPQTPIFSDLGPRAFVELLQRCSLLRFQPGEVIVSQGDPGKSFFVISSGTVKVRRLERTGEAIDLAQLHEGAFFGEMALLSDGPRTASVVADSEVELLEFPAEVLTHLMATYPSARRAVEKFTRSRLLAGVMATSPLFRPFDQENRKLLIERFLLREVAAGETVIEEGKPGDGLYVVMQGRFQIRRHQAGGEPLLLSELHEGDIFGEISVLTRSNATASVVAAGPARVLRLPRQVFDEVILTHPQILELVAKLSEERMQTTEAVVSGRVACDTEGLMLL
jgi:CRP-like cAMP-binding protein/tetratricopeptide (TPR) repeat protein